MPTNKLDNNLVGATLSGRYYLEAVIGSGGFATVYRARDTQFRVKQVAVKVLNQEHTQHEEDRVRFKNEAMIAGQIEDENEHIVRVSEYGEWNGRCYYVMEHLQGTSLRTMLERHRGAAMPWIHALQIAEQLCAALDVAHRHGIVHRDLKPENVFLVRRKGVEHVKLLDLGIAKVLTSNTITGARKIESITGSIFGSAHYMSPEQVRGLACDCRADIYSLGVVMYEMLSGRVPFTDDSEFEVLSGHVNKDPPRFAALVPMPRVPAAVEAIVRRALAKETEGRFADVRIMRKAMWTELSKAQRGPQREPIMAALPVDELDGAVTQPRLDVERILRERAAASTAVAGSTAVEPSAPAGEPVTALHVRSVTTVRTGDSLLSPSDPTPTNMSKKRSKYPTIDHGTRRPGSSLTTRRAEEARSLTFGTWAGLCGLLVSAFCTACPAGAALGMVVWPEWNRGSAESTAQELEGPAERVPSLQLGGLQAAARDVQQAPQVGEKPGIAAAPVASQVAEIVPAAPVPAAPVAPAKAAPERDFNYETARQYVRGEHLGLIKCLQGRALVLSVNMRIAPDGNVRKISVKSDSVPLRQCVTQVLSFGFDTSPRGGAFNYVMTGPTDGKLTPLPLGR